MRKALAAFLMTLLGLPFAAWIAGDQPFSWGSVISGVVGSLVAGLGVYLIPNADQSSSPPPTK